MTTTQAMVDIAGVPHVSQQRTMELQWAQWGNYGSLEQKWIITEYEPHKPARVREEWRPIPTAPQQPTKVIER